MQAKSCFGKKTVVISTMTLALFIAFQLAESVHAVNPYSEILDPPLVQASLDKLQYFATYCWLFNSYT